MNACRKLGRWRAVKDTSGGPRTWRTAKAGQQPWDLLVEGASLSWNQPLGGGWGSDSWPLWMTLGCRGKLQVATRGVSDSDRPDRDGPTTSTRSIGWDTIPPTRGGDSIAAGQSSANCLTTQGWKRQQWPTSSPQPEVPRRVSPHLLVQAQKEVVVERAKAQRLGMACSRGYS